MKRIYERNLCSALLQRSQKMFRESFGMSQIPDRKEKHFMKEKKKTLVYRAYI